MQVASITHLRLQNTEMYEAPGLKFSEFSLDRQTYIKQVCNLVALLFCKGQTAAHTGTQHVH